MQALVETSGLLLFFVFLALLVSAVFLQAGFVRTLRGRHPAIWERLGRPTMILSNSISTSLRVQRYLWSSKYKELGDSAVDRAASALKVVGVAYLLAFGLLVVVLFVSEPGL